MLLLRLSILVSVSSRAALCLCLSVSRVSCLRPELLLCPSREPILVFCWTFAKLQPDEGGLRSSSNRKSGRVNQPFRYFLLSGCIKDIPCYWDCSTKWPPLSPGTAPLTAKRPLSTSTLATFSPRVVLLTPPVLPAILITLSVCWGNLCPMEPPCLAT